MLPDRPTLQDCQRFHEWLDKEKGFSQDLPLNVMLLVEEVGEVAKEVRRLQGAMGHPEMIAKEGEAREHLRDELADCLAYIVKLANYVGIDLELAYVRKMRYNMGREWNE
ncbi:MazG nucleotide pyrophosphohydrolase domain-containing protein [Sulfoacidibacillus thermotolerans]|uniref:NTP pyrophosphohydrolase MazG-like domain-containing protein n=1 Tax=Sulfoacidibacillus thermotolerans TaxID=1765684 RepID=A0A2U3DCJ5_SULT2|nr:MazG nucleotide pyrophosphohydrolase domain-containing protein [Sulfoacidibacillus thermotolerans]PWI58965.1 hypothetical protein BM613_02520 [Sulfoacidibacillus thermotolerans]